MFDAVYFLFVLCYLELRNEKNAFFPTAQYKYTCTYKQLTYIIPCVYLCQTELTKLKSIGALKSQVTMGYHLLMYVCFSLISTFSYFAQVFQNGQEKTIS